MSQLLNGECSTCAQIQRLIDGGPGDSVTLKADSTLVKGGLCNVHEPLFKQLEKFPSPSCLEPLSERWDMFTGLHYAIKDDKEPWIHMERASEGTIRFKSSQCHQENEDLLLTRLIDGSLVDDGIGRLIDRNWIDVELLKQWLNCCLLNHGNTCSPTSNRYLPRPNIPFLIDVVDDCIVETGQDVEYVALSYVWGDSNNLKTTRETLPKMTQPGAFERVESLPRTIRDAIGLVQRLGYRYLWVDSLCIVQDDQNLRAYLCENMSAVFAYASFTIVAADGTHAESGLKGIKGLSSPRHNPCVLEWPGGVRMNRPAYGGLNEVKWNERGWVFQEYLFSTRRLIFVSESIRWECRNTCFWEEHCLPGIIPTTETRSRYEMDTSTIRVAAGATSMTFPDMVAFKTLVKGFTERCFTHNHDAMDAFSGILTAIAPNFRGGFLWGMPVMFFDISLLWRTRATGDVNDSNNRRRWDPLKENENTKHAPTWSWTSWQGPIATDWVWTNEEWILYSPIEWFYNADPIRRITPLVSWFIRETKDSKEDKDIPYRNMWYMLKQQYSAPGPPQPPSGWTRWEVTLSPEHHKFCLDQEARLGGNAHYLLTSRDDYPPRYYYTHESMPSTKFCYPLPLRQEPPTTSKLHLANDTSSRLLCGSTHSAMYRLKQLEDEDGEVRIIVKPDNSEQPVGRLWPDGLLLDTKVQDVELVAISMRYQANDHERWKQPFGAEPAQVVNVLWVEWTDRIAYRKGIGEVNKDVWEDGKLDVVELVLG